MKKIILITIFFIISLNAKELMSDRTLTEGELANGFKYTIKQNAKPAKTASFRLVVKVGSLQEDEDQRGIAHLVEHLAFNGSKHFKGNELIKFLESLGVAFGSHLNASTGTTRTIYQLEVPLKNDNLQKAMIVFSDWAGGLDITQKELDKERGVVLEEERIGASNKDYRIYKKIHKMLYKGTRFENRMPIGLKKVIKNISLKRVKDFYKTWYQPRFMNLVVVGDFDVKKIENLIKKSFGSLKNSNERTLYSQHVNLSKSEQIEIFRDKEVVKMSANLMFADRYKKIKTQKDYKEEFKISLIEKLFALKSSELDLLKNPSAKDVNFRPFSLGDNGVNYTFSTSFVEENGIKAFSQMLDLIQEVKVNGFSKKDYEFVKKDILSTNENELKNLKNKTSSSIARKIAYYKTHDEILVDERYAVDLERELLKHISIDELNAKFRKIVSLKNPTIYFVVPEDYSIDTKQIKNAFKSVSNAKISTKKEQLLPDEIKTKSLQSVKIVSQKHNEKFDFYEFRLENGVKVVYKYNDYEKDKVVLNAFSKGGYSLYEQNLLPSAKKSIKMINQSGLGKYNSLEVAKIYADKIVEFEPKMSRYFEGFEGESSRKDFRSLLKGIYLLATDFRLDKNMVFNEKIKMLEKLKKEKNAPNMVFKNEYDKFYYNNKRYQRLDKKDIQSINEKDILDVYKDRFSDFNNFTFFIIGDVKKDEVLKYAKLYLGNLPTKKRDESFKDRGIRHIKGKHDFIKNISNQNISTLFLTYTKPTPYSLVEKIKLRALSDVLETKLMEFIREEKSGVYGISVSGYFKRLPVSEGVISIHFSCDPKRKDELMGYVKKIIQELKSKEVNQKYTDAFIKKNLVVLDEISHKNEFWEKVLEKAYKYQDEILSLDEYRRLYSQITPDIVKQIAEKYFSTKDIIYGELNPKKGIK